MKYIVISVFCLFKLSILAQTDVSTIEFFPSIAAPINQFAINDVSKKAYFGIGGELSFPLMENSPMRLGFSFSYYWMGERNKKVILYDSINNYDDVLKVKLKGSMMPLHVHFKLDPMNYTDFPIVPYVGGFGGMRTFISNHKITLEKYNSSEPKEDNNRRVSFTWSSGFEVGLYIRVGKEMMIDLRYERAYGGKAKYLDLSSVKYDNKGDVSYSRKESTTDIEIYTIGLRFLLI